METGDIVTEFATSTIVEDDLNGIFNGLEPLEDPKDDMFFFGGKDLLQKIREKNPNDIPASHKPNAPNKPLPPPVSVVQDAHQIMSAPLETISQPVALLAVPAAICPPLFPAQPTSAISLHYNDKSSSANTSLATATASAIYLDNYLAASGQVHPTYAAGHPQVPVVIAHAGPPPLRPKHERPRMPSKHSASALKKMQVRAAIKNLNAAAARTYAQLSRSSGTIPNTIHNTITAAPLSVSADHITAPLYASNTSISNPATPLYVNPPNTPVSTPPPTPNASGLHSSYPTLSKVSKRSHSSLHKSSELKKHKVLYNPNTLQHSSSDQSVPSLGSSGTIVVDNSHANALNASGTFEVVSVATNVELQGTQQDRNAAFSQATMKGDSGSGRRAHHNAPPANINAYYGYVGTTNNSMQNVYVSHPLMFNNPANVIPEASYPQRSTDSPPVPDPSPAPPTNNPNTLYSNLYLYSFNNNNNNNNATIAQPNVNTNSGVIYANTANFTRPQTSDNQTYANLYNYNNLCNVYGGYANSNTSYIKHTKGVVYPHESSGYRNEPPHDDDIDDPDDSDYRGHTKLRRSKKFPSDEDDDYRKPRKVKRRSKRAKSPLVQYTDALEYEEELKSSREVEPEVNSKTGPSPPPFTPPLSPAGAKPKSKPSANLFENTPKIKISEVPVNTKISKLGKKLLEAANLDWRSPFSAQENAQTTTTPLPEEADSAYGETTQTTSDTTAQNNSPEPVAYTPVLPVSEENSGTTTPVLAEPKLNVFAEYDGVPERKSEILYFVANNVEALMNVSTKIEVSLSDFKASALGSKIRQRLEVMATIKTALQLGLVSTIILYISVKSAFETVNIQESQFAAKQQQFLDAFTFGVEKPQPKPAAV